jgi:glutamate-1-semialdehyde aminotransferase
MKNIWKKSCKIIPGGNTLLSKRPELWLPKKWPSHFIKANGINVTSIGNKKYKDFVFAVGTNILGYANKFIDKPVIKAINNGTMSSLNCYEEFELAEELLKINKWADMVKFTRGGGEANSLAVRIARAASGKQNVAFCGYHGWHDWYVASNLKDKNSLKEHLMSGISTDGVPLALKKTVHPFIYNDFVNLEKIVAKKNIGTIIMEVKRNFDPTNHFLQKVRQLCNKKKIILIFDECTTGFRANYGGLHQSYKVIPDMVMFGKALGNGYAIAAVLGKREIMEAAKNSFISSSFWGERVGFVAGLNTLKLMKKIKSWEIIKKTSEYIKQNLKILAKENNLDMNVMGIPGVPVFVFNSKNNLNYKTLIAQEMMKKKFLASNLIFTSTEHKKRDIDDYFYELSKVFKIIQKCENGDKIKRYLKSPVVYSGFKRLN